ncbi:MAG TPA: hypothetical protein VFT12_00705 [Thermoanaerobaculia bacterium]|nr:hypothetical protein [Thermoanaerobaculia bacterium]
MRRTIPYIAVAALLSLGACREDQPTEAEPPAVVPSTTMAGVPGAAADGQGVHLIEYAIHMPQTINAGSQTFRIENAGKEIHSFEIEGNGVHASLPSPLSAGSRGQLDVNLPPGTYTVYCPVEDHRQRGMSMTVTVK